MALLYSRLFIMFLYVLTKSIIQAKRDIISESGKAYQTAERLILERR